MNKTTNIIKAQEQELTAIELNDLNTEIIDQFINSLDIKPISKKAYSKSLFYFIGYLEKQGIQHPQRSTILEYKQHLTDNYTASTVGAYLTSVRQFFTWLNAETGYPLITAGIKNPHTSRTGHLKDALTAPQAKDLLTTINTNNLKGKRDLALIELMTLTGLRTIEVIRADIQDLRQLDGSTVLYIQGKGRDEKDEYVKVPQSVLNAITDYLQARNQQAPIKENEPLFTSCSNRSKNQRLTTRSISRICKQSMKQAGINSNRLTAHSLRHTAVTFALKAGASIREVQTMARHSNPLTTERYAHDLKRLENSAEDMAEKYLLNVA